MEHKYKISFDKHADIDFSFDEIIKGALFTFTQINTLVITGYKRYAGKAKSGELIYEGDRVIAGTGRKTKPDYETTVVINEIKPCKLSPNLGIMVDEASTYTIRRKL